MAADELGSTKGGKKVAALWVGGPGPTRPGSAGLCRRPGSPGPLSFIVSSTTTNFVEALVENV